MEQKKERPLRDRMMDLAKATGHIADAINRVENELDPMCIIAALMQQEASKRLADSITSNMEKSLVKKGQDPAVIKKEALKYSQQEPVLDTDETVANGKGEQIVNENMKGEC